MAHREYLIHYPNGLKQHVSRVELAAMNGLERIGNKAYRAPAASLEQTNGPAYLAGLFTIEFRGKRHKERMETERGMIVRLERAGVLCESN
jgi:hypothetical protein